MALSKFGFLRKTRKSIWLFKHSLTDNAGISLIEVLVVIGILVLIVGSGVANFRRLQKRSQVKVAARRVEQAIRNAQKSAASGVKPAGCDTLQNYQITLGGATLGERNYQIDVICSNAIYAGDTTEIARNVLIVTEVVVTYNLSGMADVDATVCVHDAADLFSYEISVTRGGAVDFETVGTCTLPTLGTWTSVPGSIFCLDLTSCGFIPSTIGESCSPIGATAYCSPCAFEATCPLVGSQERPPRCECQL